MSIEYRYFVYKNPFQSYIRMINNPLYGFSDIEDETLYIDIPFLVLGSYYRGASEGICYYIKSLDKIYIKRVTLTTYSLGSIDPIALNYFNGKPVYTNANRDEFLFYTKYALNDQDNELKNCWGYTSGNKFRYSNACLPALDDWNDYDLGYVEGRTNTGAYFYRIDELTDNQLQLNKDYTGYRAYINANSSTSSDNIDMFNIDKDTYNYTRSDEAIDLTPEELRPLGMDFAGVWTNSKGAKIYLGLPVFDFYYDNQTVRMIPCTRSRVTEESRIPSEIDSSHINYSRTYIYKLMTGYDNDHALYYLSIFKSEWNGTSYSQYESSELAFDYEKRDVNGGYWKVDYDWIMDIEEETIVPVMEWYSTDEESNHSELTNSGYIGSVLQSGLHEKYLQDESVRKPFKKYVIKAPNFPYYYTEEEENKQ